MQAIEFETNLENGLMKIPSIYREWYNQPVKVILLKRKQESPQQEDVWAEVQMLQSRLKKRHRNFSDSADLIREERDQ